MESITSITQLIATVGFPIVMCLLMGYYIVSTIKENTQTMNNLCGKLDILLDRIGREDEEDKE